MMPCCILQPPHATIFVMKDRLTPPTKAQIAAAREKKGHTKEEAAEFLGYNKSAWGRWESGKVQMPGVLFDYYLIRTGQRNP